MKKDLHPKWYPDAKVICNGEVVMTVGSTQPELRVDVWSGNHPFFTGEQRIIDTAGQVDRFMKRLDQYGAHQSDKSKRQRKNLQKIENRFMKQQLVALDLTDKVSQTLHDANIITVGDLADKLANDPDALLAIAGFGQKSLEQAQAKLDEAKEAYFQAQG